MELCRICLSTSADKDISQLKSDVDGTSKTCVEIFQFCLDIKVPADFQAKLCVSCFDKLLLFFEFKCLALRSDVYLKHVECLEPEVEAIKEKKANLNGKEVLDVKKEASDFEDTFQDFNSDDELLIVIKKEAEDKTVKDEVKKQEPKKRNRTSRSRNTNNEKVSVQKYQKSSLHKQKCKICGKRVKILKSHLKLHQPHPKGEKFKCKNCEVLFITRSERNDHYNLVHRKQQTTSQCEICGKYYTCQAHVETHQKQVHFNIRPFKCELCPKTFHVKYRLNIHMTTSHSNERSFQCSECGKRFRCRDALRLHRTRHNPSKQFACQICHKTFNNPSNLYAHHNVHRERKFECPECGTKFTRATHARRHLSAVHGKQTETPPCGRPQSGSKPSSVHATPANGAGDKS